MMAISNLAEHKLPQRKRAEVQRFAIVIPKRDSNTTETRPRDGSVLPEPGQKRSFIFKNA